MPTTDQELTLPDELKPDEYLVTPIPVPLAAQPKRLIECQVKWNFTMVRRGTTLSGPYATGIGHLEIAKGCNLQKPSVDLATAVRRAIACGKIAHDGLAKRRSPDIEDILACVVMDSDVLNYARFEDWALELGYDLDSRSAERTYHECMKTALPFNQMWSESERERLQEFFRDW